jgi:hypothetical protein
MENSRWEIQNDLNGTKVIKVVIERTSQTVKNRNGPCIVHTFESDAKLAFNKTNRISI